MRSLRLRPAARRAGSLHSLYRGARSLLARLSALPATLLAALLAVLTTVAMLAPAHAGVMTRETLAQRFPSPFMIGEKDKTLPVWPIFKQNATENELVAYVFESVDYAPIPGFAGVPMNLLIALDPKGRFLDVQVLSQHEPVFVDGLGEGPMFRFVKQYKGLALADNIAISNSGDAGREGGTVRIDGVAKATASVRILNQSVLSSALKVARAKLGFSGAEDPDQIARVNPKVFESLDVAALRKEGLLKHVKLTNADVEKAFLKSDGEGLDSAGNAHPDDTFVALDVAPLSVPSVGRNLLSPADWTRLMNRLEPGDTAILVTWRGRWGVVSDDFVRGTVPDRLVLRQGKLPVEMRDLDMDLRPQGAPEFQGVNFKIFRVIAQAGLDAARPMEFALRVTRNKGILYPERISREFPFKLELQDRMVIKPQADNKGWIAIWKQRWKELAVLVAALAVLAGVLWQQRALTANDRRFAWFRTGYLLFTLFFIGWYAQGQLSIVNITGVLQALRERRSLGFFLYDPMTVILWAFIAVTFFVWGRGTFCGWLCPFGALQEFTGKLGQWMKLPQLRISRRLNAKLVWVKYLLLAGILASALFAPALTDKIVELEPFKTAITLAFVRSWPFVAYAGGLLVLSAFSYKFFCRYLCPFGAGVAVLGRVRLLNWLPRRAECGKPCQTCKHRCEYHAIRNDGSIRYDECFQCMDCVVIHDSPEKCAPLILEAKRGRTIPVRAMPADALVPPAAGVKA